MKCGVGAGCEDSGKEALDLVQGQVEQLSTCRKGEVVCDYMERWEGGRQLLATVIGVARTVFSARLMPGQRHCIALSAQAPYRVSWGRRGLAFRPGPAASRQGREGGTRQGPGT